MKWMRELVVGFRKRAQKRADRKRLLPYTRRLKALNAEIVQRRTERDEDIGRLSEEKDDLIDFMQGDCRHGHLIEAAAVRTGPGAWSQQPIRLCLICGATEFLEKDTEWVFLVGAAKMIGPRRFMRKLGRTLKHVGVNI